MNILVVNNKELNQLPPVRNLIKVLLRNGHRVTVISEDSYNAREEISSENIKFVILPSVSTKISFVSASVYLKNRTLIRKYVIDLMKENDILWTTTDKTVRDIGKIVFNYKHVMQLMELIEDTPLFPKQNILWMHIDKYARNAYKVVVPEYNRAQMQKVWWKLEELPIVLPNKMADIEIDSIPNEINPILHVLENEQKKIILYQGLFGNDRNFEVFAKAFNDSEEYKLYIMGRDNERRKQLCQKYKNVGFIPFYKPPYHWLVTQKAYIGLLPYQVGKVGYNSLLNGIYCAPNKIFDYAAYGIPMLGTDVPGLTIPFLINDIGTVCKKMDTTEILKAVKVIDERYEEMSRNCKNYFDSVNLDKIVEEIIS